ncbi:uncharacterized protein [Rutidosis leptorrhynchoides]|uniref:uncharacterized protein n=1 Tax=Rutidosis leptorrhynchoides TaxID=125765 RepID=UPI003A999F47
MMNSKGFFFFKFATEQGMFDVLENGPWIIRTIPIILNQWTPTISLTKEDLTKVPVWVKMHGVPLSGFTEDEVNAKHELKESLVVATPSQDGKNIAKDDVKIEYEWRPPRCAYCEVFGHVDSSCPKAIPVKEVQPKEDDGFKQVAKKQVKGVIIGKKKNVEGQMGGTNKVKFVYRPVRKENQKNDGNANKASTSGGNNANMFSVLKDLDPEGVPNVQQDKSTKNRKHAKDKNITVGILVDEESDVEEDQLNVYDHDKGASTPSKLKSIGDNVFYAWDWTSNSNKCVGGTRIMLGWNPAIVQSMVLASTNQVIHCQIRMVHDLEMHAKFVGNNPWVILGDFNASLSIDETTAGSSCMTLAMREFMECVNNIQVCDINNMGMKFTWNQKPHAKTGILKKIDRVLGNDSFLSNYVNAYAIFQPYRISDHSPSILKIPSSIHKKPKMFRFSNYVADQDGFIDCVKAGWDVNIMGYSMFLLVKKLRGLKKPIRKLMWEKGNIHTTVKRLRHELDTIQKDLDKDPNSIELREAEANKLKEFNDALWDEERFLKQKSKIEWLRAGDSNTSYFQKVIKGRANRNRINAIMDQQGNIIEGNTVADHFLEHYMAFLDPHKHAVQLLIRIRCF